MQKRKIVKSFSGGMIMMAENKSLIHLETKMFQYFFLIVCFQIRGKDWKKNVELKKEN